MVSRGDNPMLPSRAFNIYIKSSGNETKRLLLSEKITSAWYQFLSCNYDHFVKTSRCNLIFDVSFLFFVITRAFK